MAELMLGLAMLFFAANSLGFDARSESATPTPPPNWQATIEAHETALAGTSATATTPLPTPTPLPPTATPMPTPTPDTTLATANAELETMLATLVAMPTPTAPPTPTPDTCVETVNLEETELKISVGDWVGRSDDERNAALQRAFAGYRGQRVGLSLTFGHSLDPDESKNRAQEANTLLPVALPDMFDSNSKYKEYTNRTGAEPDVAVSFGIYFIKSACA